MPASAEIKQVATKERGKKLIRSFSKAVSTKSGATGSREDGERKNNGDSSLSESYHSLRLRQAR